MKANEARRVAELVNARAKMGDVFAEIKKAVEAGEFSLYFDGDKLTDEAKRVLKADGYGVTAEWQDDDFGSNSRHVGDTVQW